MQLSIHQQSKIREIKDQFSRLFPFLKLEFFQHQHSGNESAAPFLRLSAFDCFASQLDDVTNGAFRFTAAISVYEFKQRLQQEHGLPVQVFRKSGNIWLETIQTETLSLEQQNKLGKNASLPISFNINTLFL